MNKAKIQNSKDEILEVIEILVYKIMYKGAYSNILLNSDKLYLSLNLQAKKFVTNVVYGTVENWLLLNYIINRMAQNQNKIKSDLRCVLCAGLYILKFLDKKEPAIVVNRFVNYVKYAKPYAKSFVNLIFRKYLREGIELPQNLDVESLSINYSHPQELVQFFMDRFGIEKTIAILKANNTKSTVSCRVNTKYFERSDVLNMLDEEGIEAIPSKLSANALEIRSMNASKIENLSAFQKGAIYIQDLSSILHGELVEVQNNDMILDLCSAPGGKITAIAQNCNSTNEIYACDIGKNKLNLIRNNFERMKLKDCKLHIMEGDATILKKEWENKFDVVIADVPCSGLGVIRNKPEIRYRFDLDEIRTMVSIQYKILENAYRYLKKGGYLVYSTCTINPDENEAQIRRLLQNNIEASVCNINIDSINGQICQNMINLIQSNDETDGFFACKIKKGGSENL